MVGVPRSQGCRNCRRKKKGCDQAKPACGQCARLLLRCVYDERQWRFVSHDASSPRGTAAFDVDATVRNAADAPTSSALGQQPQSISRTALEVEISAAFWTAYWPQEERSASLGGVGTSPWIETLQYFATQDNTARIALDAVALTALGRLREDEVLLHNGTLLYARALHATNLALQHPVRATSDAVLALCRILGLYETFRREGGKGVPSQGTDWQRHVDGTCRLIELRGLEKHASGHSKALFSEARGAAMISGITRRKPNIFSTDRWRVATHLGTSDSLRMELHGVMLTIPGIMQAFDELSHLDGCGPSSAGSALLERCIDVSRSLEAWESKALQICAESSRDLSGAPIGLKKCCTKFSYGFFHMVMTYWVACLVLSSTGWLLLRRISQGNRTSGQSSQASPPRIPDPQPYASNISIFSSHYFEPQAGLWGPQSASFPMGAALHFYAATGQYESPPMEHMLSLFRWSKQARMTGEFLRSMAADATPPALRGDASSRQDHERMSSRWYGVGGSRGASQTTVNA